MLPWFRDNNKIPVFLAPMAGVTDIVFRTICKELGADVMVTEFVSAEGILQMDSRTKKYTEFEDGQRPVGVQLFGADGKRMAEAARKIVDWKEPDFIDLNFGCPVKKVVSKNGGSSLLKNCPLLTEVASEVAKGVNVPVTAKIRVGWDNQSINALEVGKIMEDVGIASLAIHGRTRSQGYRGEANWDIIGEVASELSIPVVGNGDITSGFDVKKKFSKYDISGIMIGRAAMTNPWVFKEIKEYLKTGEILDKTTEEERWKLIIYHCKMAINSTRYGSEKYTMQAMRSRLMSYSKGMRGGKFLRQNFTTVASIMELETMAENHLAWLEQQSDRMIAIS